MSLQPPGNGLPPFEKGMLTAALRIGSAFLTDNRALKMFIREADTILALVDDCDFDYSSQQILIPRYVGMEDSSRNWSLFMVLEHLRMVNRDILRTIDTLKSGVVPRGELKIADYKPDPDCSSETIDMFRDDVWNFDGEIRRLMPLRGTARFAHPWFGQLDAHGWLCLASVHMRVHRKQALKITALMGRA